MKISLLIIGFGLIVGGCSTRSDMSAKMNYVSIGMAKKEVINSVGQPQSVSAKGNMEYLNYNLCSRAVADFPEYVCKERNDYYIRVVNGKVESYGKLGDFDSTKITETKQTIDLNIKKQR